MYNPSFSSVVVDVWRPEQQTTKLRVLPEETAIALTYGRVTQAVMLATPSDLMDFAIGFSLNEGIIQHSAEIDEMNIVPRDGGIELRMDIANPRMDALLKRRRQLAGATGCGLCGMESLLEVMRPPPRLAASSLQWQSSDIGRISEALSRVQVLNQVTHAVHAAAFWTVQSGIVEVREDVGRHNALDKLAGALAMMNIPPAGGVLALTSRVSVELVQKAARMGINVIVAVSAPTGLAVRVAKWAGITLIGVARTDGFEVFTCPERIN